MSVIQSDWVGKRPVNWARKICNWFGKSSKLGLGFWKKSQGLTSPFVDR